MTDHTSPAAPIDYPDLLGSLSRKRMAALEDCANAVLTECWQDARLYAMECTVLDAALAVTLRGYTDVLRTSPTGSESDRGAAS